MFNTVNVEGLEDLGKHGAVCVDPLVGITYHENIAETRCARLTSLEKVAGILPRQSLG